MGRLSCTMPVCFSTLREPSKLESPYLITKATHAGSNRLLNDIKTMVPELATVYPIPKANKLPVYPAIVNGAGGSGCLRGA